MPTEYANSAACRAAGVEPVPRVGDYIGHSLWDWTDDGGPSDRLTVRPADLNDEAIENYNLLRRGDVTIPQHSDTPEGK